MDQDLLSLSCGSLFALYGALSCTTSLAWFPDSVLGHPLPHTQAEVPITASCISRPKLHCPCFFLPRRLPACQYRYPYGEAGHTSIRRGTWLCRAGWRQAQGGSTSVSRVNCYIYHAARASHMPSPSLVNRVHCCAAHRSYKRLGQVPRGSIMYV